MVKTGVAQKVSPHAQDDAAEHHAERHPIRASVSPASGVTPGVRSLDAGIRQRCVMATASRTDPGRGDTDEREQRFTDGDIRG